MIDLGEDAEKTGSRGPKGFHIGQFVADYEGVYTVTARQERILQHGTGPKFRGVRFARSDFIALPVPTIAEAQKLRIDRETRNEDGLEIVPVSNLFGISGQNSVTLEVRYKGKPAPGKVVSILQKIAGAESVQDLTTGQQGRVTPRLGPVDSYLARTKVDERTERSEGQYELSSYEATYVFQVFNRP